MSQHRESDMRVHTNLSFSLYGSRIHVEQALKDLRRLLELNGYRDAKISGLVTSLSGS
jgi:hypothetical protein